MAVAKTKGVIMALKVKFTANLPHNHNEDASKRITETLASAQQRVEERKKRLENAQYDYDAADDDEVPFIRRRGMTDFSDIIVSHHRHVDDSD